jgi:hypothetical protein
LEIALELGEEKHPADEIALALSRAGGILSSLTHCYDVSNADFATGAPFLAEAIKTAESILVKANESLTKLYQDYNLEALSESDLRNNPVDVVERDQEKVSHLSFARARRLNENIAFSVQSQEVSRLSSNLDSILDTLPDNIQAVTVEQMIDHPAQSYQELLEKLTAMADAAAYQTQSEEGSLLPILESLRADMMRLKTA